MIKHNKLGKVVNQVGGFRIREIVTPKGKEYGLYTGKRLFKTALNSATLIVMANKIIRLLEDEKKGKKHPYSSELLKEYHQFINGK